MMMVIWGTSMPLSNRKNIDFFSLFIYRHYISDSSIINMVQYKKNGSLNVITGSMFSGKTTELIRRYNRHKIGGKKCIMIKPSTDTRFEYQKVMTHNGESIEALVTEYLSSVDKIVMTYNVICVDEIQFFKDGDIMCDKWATRGHMVEVSGLNGTYKREPWPIMSNLFAMANHIQFIEAVCKETGNDASYSHLIDKNVDKSSDVIVGGTDLYSAVDRETFFSNYNENGIEKYYLKMYLDRFCKSSNNLDKHIADHIGSDMLYMDIVEKIPTDL
jgi:thymidine kinase